MVGSEEFAAQIFDALARRRGITAMVLTKDQVREFWEQLSDPGFDAKLQTFFDMYVLFFSPPLHSDTTFRKVCSCLNLLDCQLVAGLTRMPMARSLKRSSKR